MIRDLLEQANDIQTKLNLLEQAKKELATLVDPKNTIFNLPMVIFYGPGSDDRKNEPETAHIKNTRALRRLMELLK